MKNTTKLLNLLTAFLSVIGICSASLVCFIVAYTQLNGGFPAKHSNTQNTAVIQADNNATEVFASSMSYDDNSPSAFLPNTDTDTINDSNNTELVSLTSDSTSTEIYENPTFEYDRSSTTIETDYTTDPETNNDSSVIYTAPIEQGSTILPLEQNDQNAIYPSDNATDSQISVLATNTVWLSETGTKYHSIDHCGRMNPDKATAVSLEYAISNGFAQCEKCF